MKTIWKFKLQVKAVQEVALPRGAVPLSVQTQGGEPCLWALVDESAPTEQRMLVTYGTGHPVTTAAKDMAFLGTYQLENGALVFHAFLAAAHQQPPQAGSVTQPPQETSNG